jgi:Icc-related predicted phosphoesterase
VSTTLFYASDIHGSDVLWRKFINAGKFYEAKVLIMGGDITGKGVVPIVDTGRGFRVEQVTGKELLDESQLPTVEKRVRDMGFYPYRIAESDLEAVYTNESAVDEVFRQVMRDSVARWMSLAEERLANTGIKLFVMIGNDDDTSLREVIATSTMAIDPEDKVVDVGEDFRMYSCGWANPTPWNTPREMPDDQFEGHLEQHLVGLERPERAIFNFHAPPYGTGLDRAPVLDANLKPVVSGGQIQMDYVGSRAVRAVIERYQPALGLHGHIHESRAVAKLGKTLCINTGSAYAEGVLHGALVTIDKKKGVQQHLLASG